MKKGLSLPAFDSPSSAFFFVFIDFDWVLPSFTGFYLVLPSFTGFYLVLLGFT